MDKNKLIGAIVGILIGVLGSLGVLNSDAVKGEICGTSAVAK